MKNYFIGKLRSILSWGSISIFALIDQYSKVSKKAKVLRFSKVYNSSIDEFSYLGKRSSLIFTKVGKYCSVADNVQIGLGTHPIKRISTSPFFYSKNNIFKKAVYHDDSIIEFSETIVGNDVWIGYGALIMGGIKIGNGAIIAAGSVVTKDVPDYSIVGGVPAKLIKYRFDEKIREKLLESEWWNSPLKKINETSICSKKELTLKDITNFVDKL